MHRPCSNGGTCEDLVNGVRCHCAAGYQGNFCRDETPVRDSTTAVTTAKTTSDTTRREERVTSVAAAAVSGELDSDDGLRGGQLLLVILIGTLCPLMLIAMSVVVTLCMRRKAKLRRALESPPPLDDNDKQHGADDNDKQHYQSDQRCNNRLDNYMNNKLKDDLEKPPGVKDCNQKLAIERMKYRREDGGKQEEQQNHINELV